MKAGIPSSKLKQIFLGSFLICIMTVSIYIISYFNENLGKTAKLRDKLITSKHEGSLSENLGFLTLFTTEIADQLDLESLEEKKKTSKIKKYLLNLKQKVEKLRLPQAGINLSSVTNLNLDQERSPYHLMAWLHPKSLARIDISDLNLRRYISNRFPTRPYLQSSDEKTNPKSFVFIPSQLVSTENNIIKISNTVKREIIFSKVFEEDLEKIFEDLRGENISQVYFIPLSGFVRILSKESQENPIIHYKEMFQGISSFSNRPYFTKTMSGRDEFRRSNIYLDTAGFGIVVTYSVIIRNTNIDIIGMIGIDRKIESLRELLSKVNLGSQIPPKDFHSGTFTIRAKKSDGHSIIQNEESYNEHYKKTFKNETIAKRIAYAMENPNELFKEELIAKMSFSEVGSTIYLLRIGPKEVAYFLFNPKDAVRKYQLLTALYILSILCIAVLIVITLKFFLSTSKAERTYAEVVSNLHGGLIIIDMKGRIKLYNSKMGELVEDSKLRKKNFLQDCLAGESRIEYKRLIQKLKEGFEFTGRIIRADGTIFPAIITSAPIKYPGIKNAHMLIIIPSEQLERTIAAKFIHSFSHALKTPVASILLLSDRLRRKTAFPKFDHYFSLMKQQMDEFTNMVTNLLGFSKLESEDIRPIKETVNLASLLRSSVKTFKERARKAHIEVIENIPERIIADADKNLFLVILNNLLENALKYTIEGKIWIHANSNPDEVMIYIIDTGIGVFEDERDKIFDKFYRGRAPEVQSKDGIGIGLYLSRKYLELHGGVLIYEPRIEEKLKRIKSGRMVELKEKGSKFIIQIPRE